MPGLKSWRVGGGELTAFDLVQRRAKRPAGVPDKGLARTITKVGGTAAGAQPADEQ
ncbi:hypothetical protein [Micromonospora sp. NPDC050276]|uniref:hypothetical protein n=1 Tax=Micromonospora sp. NPDC050276 TaxID=3364278 RepID=UPI0037A378CB